MKADQQLTLCKQMVLKFDDPKRGESLSSTQNYGNIKNNREFPASGDQVLPVENSYFFVWEVITMKKKHLFLGTVLSLLVIMLLVNYIENNEAAVNTSQVVESYGGDRGMYKATVTFDMFPAKKASNVKVMVVYPNDTIEYHDVSSPDGHYLLNITKNVEEFTLDKSKGKSPEFLITWISGDKKRIRYVSSSAR
jgi:hypothetical protein